MVNFSSLGVATTETITHFHNYAKTVETAHLGKLYTTVLNGINYYVVECAAKPALAKAPEWVSSNRVVNFIQNNKGITILAAGIITLIFIVVMLHPPGDAAKSTGTGSPEGTPGTADGKKDFDVDNAARDGEVKGPDGKDEGEEVEEADSSDIKVSSEDEGENASCLKDEHAGVHTPPPTRKNGAPLPPDGSHDLPRASRSDDEGENASCLNDEDAAVQPPPPTRKNGAPLPPDGSHDLPRASRSDDEGENASCLNDDHAGVHTPPPTRKNGGSSTASTTAVPATEDKKD